MRMERTAFAKETNSKAHAARLSLQARPTPRDAAWRPSSALTAPPPDLPAALEHVKSSLRFLRNNPSGFLIFLPLNPFPSQSWSRQVLQAKRQKPSVTSFPPSPQPIRPVADLLQPRTLHVPPGPRPPATLNLFLLSYTQTGLWRIVNSELSPI